MAPSWSTRLWSGVGNNSYSNSNSSPGSNALNKDKALPRTPPASTGLQTDPFTTQAGPSFPTSPRPRIANGGHNHNRSVSHPLPRLFGRKKSLGNIGDNDGDLSLDDSVVSVPSEAQRPMRAISGKKRTGKIDDGDDKIMRRCLCCDSKVRVPRDLDKFRCMCCLTVNDLREVGGQQDWDVLGQQKRGGARVPVGLRLPLSVERTRAIIDKCLMEYLEARCLGQVEQSVGLRKADAVEQTPPAVDEEKVDKQDANTTQLSDALMCSSPPETPPADLPALATTTTATIKTFSDFEQFGFVRAETPQPGEDPIKTSPRSSAKPSIPLRKPPPPPVDITRRTPSQRWPSNGMSAPNNEYSPRKQQSPRLTPEELEEKKRYDRVKTIFRPLEEYILATFGTYESLNTSFSTVRTAPAGRTRSESHIVTPPNEPAKVSWPSPIDGLSELDAKTLLLGDIGENGSWWTGKFNKADKAIRRKKVGSAPSKPVGSKSPNINWLQAADWYELVHCAGDDWQRKIELLQSDKPGFQLERVEGLASIQEIEDELSEAREHTVRALLKVTENLLKRPTMSLKEPEDLRFLLIILSNPSLYPAKSRFGSGRLVSSTRSNLDRSGSVRIAGLPPVVSPKAASPLEVPSRDVGQHTGILKRVLGLLANSPDTCHRYLIGWFSRFDEAQLTSLVDVVASFVTHRIARCAGRTRSKSFVADGGLIPDLSGGAMNTSAQLHAAMGLSGSVKKRPGDPDQETEWASDWQIKAAAKVMSLLFAANNIWQGKRREDSLYRDSGVDVLPGMIIRPEDKARRSGQLLHTSTFYNTLLDYHDLIADFKVWESKREKFAFCQYPLFLSMGAKIKILEYDARRQMEIKAREALFDQVIRQRAIDGYFHLKVRRDCMVDDSLRQISEAVGAGQEELKKGLRVHFAGEEGVDAGGPRKEWFLMLVREVFDADHGLFVYDDDSRTCYFNPNTFETSDQYYLVGALLGLAIYNSNILDIALPPFAFRKLLAAAPTSATGNATTNVASLTGTKGQMTYTLADLAEYKPSLAAGLQQLLDFEGDVEATYCWSFVAPIERYGIVTSTPLIPNGENTAVTNSNRTRFVDAYVRHLLDTAVARQFEPFKRGFFTVCAGNALSLFRAEEIELLIRGSDESLDVGSVKAVAVHENWRSTTPPHTAIPNPADTVPVLIWFWEAFACAEPAMQRKLLSFITGSDRIPAVGATSLILRIVCGGDAAAGEPGRDELDRYPVARTCFNMLVLSRYASREELERKLWRAVEDSEGFGLK